MPHSLTVTDPNYRGRVLAVHTELTALEARELMRVYRQLGYGTKQLTVETAEAAA